MIRPRLVLTDLQLIVRGTASFLKHLVSRDQIDIGLGLFSAESSVAGRGISNRYFVRIASLSEVIQFVKLVIDIYALNVPTNMNGHYGFVAKTLKVPPRGATVVEIQYDWQQSADFLYAGTSYPPDAFWKGTYESPQLYTVIAALYDQQDNEMDRLTIFQELRG